VTIVLDLLPRAKMPGMNDRTHDERTAHELASVQPERAPESLTYAEAVAMTDHWIGGVSPESLLAPPSAAHSLLVTQPPGAPRPAPVVPTTTATMSTRPTTTPVTSPAHPTGVDIFARFPQFRGPTSAPGSRIGGNDARALDREERASRVQPGERDVRIAGLDAETAGLRERAAYAERPAEVCAQRWRGCTT
jgi:hypothetical protein